MECTERRAVTSRARNKIFSCSDMMSYHFEIWVDISQFWLVTIVY